MIQRRDFITLLGGAAAWPLAVRAQQRAMPVIGYLTGRSAESDILILAEVRRGLSDLGYAEGRNLMIEYRFADGQYDRLPALFTDLLARRVALIVYVGGVNTEPMLGIMRASQMAIVYMFGFDPLRFGLVASMNRPGGNLTGVNGLVLELSGKHLGLLHDLVPKAATIAALFDPQNGEMGRDTALRDARDATATLRQKLLVLEAGTAGEIDAQFASASELTEALR
jgi:putative tryptophan/tyrosine transport system substrate-binding protein